MLIHKQLSAGNLHLQQFLNLSLMKIASLCQGFAHESKFVRSQKLPWLSCQPILPFKNIKTTPDYKFSSPLPGFPLTTSSQQ